MKNGHFPSVSLRRHPVQLVILISFFFSPASDAGFLRFVRGSLTPRCFFVLFPAVFRGFSFFFSPASDAGFLPPLWRGRVFPFTVQSRDHLATITDIYVPSFSYVLFPRYSAVFFLLFAGLSLPGYLLGSCVRMASGHPAPHCPVSGTFAAGVLLSSPRCPVRASFASGFVLRLLAPHCMRVSLSPISYLLSSLGVLCARVPRARCPSSYVHSPALNAGFYFVHCAGCHPAF